MTTLSAGKIAEVKFEAQLEAYEAQTQMVDETMVYTPGSGEMRNAGNVLWRPVEMHAPEMEGWDLTGQEQEIIEETYPAYLGLPKGDFVKQRADDMRDLTQWKRRGTASGKQMATNLNKSVAQLIANTGSLYYRSNATSGFDFIAEAQTIMNERERAETQRCFFLNDRDSKTFAQDLAGRQTVQGRPEQVWQKGQIAQNVAQFDIYTGSYLPVITGGTATTTTTAATSFAPEGGSVNPTTHVVTNVDYRSATIPVTSSASFAVGDKVTFDGVNAIGVSSKTDTGELMTFSIVSIPNGTSVEIWPKPIALNDGALTTTEKAFANVDEVIGSGATMTRLNTDASAKSNIFFDKDSIEVIGGDIPADLMKQFEGMKVTSETLSNGLKMYFVYDSTLVDMSLRYRSFVWYGLTNKDPQRNGVAVHY